MSEIGNSNSTIALTSRQTDRPADSKPLVRKADTGSIDRFNPAAADESVQSEAANKPEQGVDLSIQALAEGDPLEKAAKALEKFIPDVNALPNTKLRINKHDETGHFVYQNIDMSPARSSGSSRLKICLSSSLSIRN